MSEAEPTYVEPPKPSLVEFAEAEKAVDDTVAPMPVWASILIILLSLSAGGWIVKWYVGTDMLQHESKVLDENPPIVNQRGRLTEPPVRQIGTNLTAINSSLAELIIDHQPKRPTSVRTLNFRNHASVSLELATLRKTINLMRSDTVVQKNLGITQDQLKAFTRVGQVAMVTQPGDYSQLLTLYTAYEAAGEKEKPAALATLQARMDAVTKQALAPTKVAAAAAVAKIRAVLTPDQWTKFETMGR